MRLRKKMANLVSFDNYYFNNLLNQANQTIQTYIAVSPVDNNISVGGGENSGFYTITISQPIEELSLSEFRGLVKQSLLDKLEGIMKYDFQELLNPNYELIHNLRAAFRQLHIVVIDCHYANQIEKEKRNTKRSI